MPTKKNSIQIVQWPFGGRGKIQKLSYFEGKSHMLPYLGNEFLLIAITKQDSFNPIIVYPQKQNMSLSQKF